MISLTKLNKHIDAGHYFFWEVLPFTKRYQLRAVTFTWENGAIRSCQVYTAADYETAKLISRKLESLNAKFDIKQLEAIAEERCWETGTR